MTPIPVRLPPEQLVWLERQTIAGISRAQAIRLCIHAAMDRGEPLIPTQQQQDTTTTTAA